MTSLQLGRDGLGWRCADCLKVNVSLYGQYKNTIHWGSPEDGGGVCTYSPSEPGTAGKGGRVCVCCGGDHDWLQALSYSWLWLIGPAFFCLSTDRKVDNVAVPHHQWWSIPFFPSSCFTVSPSLSAPPFFILAVSSWRRHTPQSFAMLAQITRTHKSTS